MLSEQTVGILNSILYPTLYTDDLMQDVNRVASLIHKSGLDPARRGAMLKAIDEACADSGWLNCIINGGDHTESEIKRFLISMKGAL